MHPKGDFQPWLSQDLWSFPTGNSKPSCSLPIYSKFLYKVTFSQQAWWQTRCYLHPGHFGQCSFRLKPFSSISEDVTAWNHSDINHLQGKGCGQARPCQILSQKKWSFFSFLLQEVLLYGKHHHHRGVETRASNPQGKKSLKRKSLSIYKMQSEVLSYDYDFCCWQSSCEWLIKSSSFFFFFIFWQPYLVLCLCPDMTVHRVQVKEIYLKCSCGFPQDSTFQQSRNPDLEQM